MKPSQRAGLIVGRRILCLYVGEALWHERLLLAQADETGNCWAIVTPDGDICTEDYAAIEDAKEILRAPLEQFSKSSACSPAVDGSSAMQSGPTAERDLEINHAKAFGVPTVARPTTGRTTARSPGCR